MSEQQEKRRRMPHRRRKVSVRKLCLESLASLQYQLRLLEREQEGQDVASRDLTDQLTNVCRAIATLADAERKRARDQRQAGEDMTPAQRAAACVGFLRSLNPAARAELIRSATADDLDEVSDG